MKIEKIEAIPLAASFKSMFRFGTTDRSTSPNVVVIIQTDDGCVGYGEACPVPAFTSETQSSIVELIESRVAPVLIGQDPAQRTKLLGDVAKVLKFAPFTVTAVDTALLDLLGRAYDTPITTLLGGAHRTSTVAHGSVGWDEDAGKMTAIAIEQAQTYPSLKLYAGRGDLDEDLDRLEAVRSAVGPDIELFVDINMMWAPSDLVRALPRVVEMNLAMLEQPLPPAAGAMVAQLVSGYPVDICADESVRTVEDSARVVSEGSATVINVGISKLGGPTAAMRAATVAAASGVGVMVGSVIEMGIATAMGLHVAGALPQLDYPSYLMGPLKYTQQITDTQVEVVDGRIAIPEGPGLGVTIDEAEIRRLDARKQ